MFHLFRKTYLDLDFRFTSQHNSIIASSDCIKDPLMYEVIGEKPNLLYKADNLKSLLKNEFDHNLESLWKYLYNPGNSERFMCFLNLEDYCFLQISFWKSIFPKAQPENIHFLHKLHIQNLKAMSFMKVGKLNESVSAYMTNLKILSENDFLKLWQEASISQVIQAIPKSELSYEYILANYFMDQQTTPEFSQKLKKVCWELVVNELDILRTDVVKGIYDYLQFDLETKERKFQLDSEVDNLIELIQSDPRFLWVLDKNINSSNSDYLLECYSAETFSQFVHHQNILFGEPVPKGGDDGKLSRIFEYAFAEKYHELLLLDIETGFGSLFFTGHDSYKVNNILCSFIYDKYRENDLSALKFLTLRSE